MHYHAGMGQPHEHPEHRHDVVGGHRTHEHLWTAANGTGLHAPPGQVVRDRLTGEVCCHVCGEFFHSLGSHVRAHGYTAAEYRRAMDLSRTKSLSSATVSEAISRRQRQSYATSSEHRVRLEPGQEMVRDGRLTELAKTGRSVRMQSDRLRSEALDAGRRTREGCRQAALSARLDQLGIADLGCWLRATYADGASLSNLAETLGIGQQRLRSELERAGVTLRDRGTNSAQGKRSRAIANEQLAAQRVGTDDLNAWLSEQHRRGVTLSELGRRVGHSSHWVRWRVDRHERSVVLVSGDLVELRHVDL